MTKDPRAVAAQLWCLPQHAHKEMDVEFAESIAQALADDRRRVWEEAAKVCEEIFDASTDRDAVFFEALLDAAKAIRAKAPA